MTNDQFAGYHKFQCEDGGEHGSFEVFYIGEGHDWGEWDGASEGGSGWYWWPCFPGCLPDGDPCGPFPTSEGAYLDALED